MELIQKFKQTIETHCLSNQTNKAYSFYIEKFLNIYPEPTQENILSFLHNMKLKGYFPSSISIARASFIYLFKNVLNKEITIKIIPPKRIISLPRPVDKEIVEKLILNTSNLKHRMVIETIYGSGLRLSETTRIKWSEIDFTNGILRVNKGKGNKDRFVKLANTLIQHLIDYKEIRYNKENEYVFDSQARPYTHISKKTVQKILENASEKARLGFKVTPHTLRHSFATHSLENGTDIRKIQEMLGHSSPKTTMVYTKVTKKTISEIESPLDRLDLTKKDTNKKNVKSNKKEMENCIDRAVISNNGHNC